MSTPAPAALLIRGLRFAHLRRGWSLAIDRFELARGEACLLSGPSGCGKSTLLHLIAGLIDPASGAVEVAGRDIFSMHGAARDAFRGRHVGMIFQTFNLLAGFSALENVLAALMFSDIPRGEHAGRARGLLERLGIGSPHARPDELSIGQQQRVAVARALACAPELVLADEPTASLDPANAEIAIGLIQEVCQERGAALLCASHDERLRARFGRQISMDQLAGTPETLRA